VDTIYAMLNRVQQPLDNEVAAQWLLNPINLDSQGESGSATDRRWSCCALVAEPHLFG